MAKKLVTIDVNDENLKVSAKPVEAKKAKLVESTEMEKLGFVEINNAAVSKKVAKVMAKGFEKNLTESTKKTVKSQTSAVEDYFDFSFKTNTNASETKEGLVEKKTIAKKTAAKTTKKSTEKSSATKSKKETSKAETKIDEQLKQAQTSNVSDSIVFDNEVCQILRVARIGSLFDCDKRAIQA